MADGFISVILEQLALITTQEAEQEIRLVVGVDEEVRRLEGDLRIEHAVLNDAEKRQVKERAVRFWLQKLKEVSYEMDDVLDEWNTAMIKLEIEKIVEDKNAENNTFVEKKKVKDDLLSMLLGKDSKEEERCPYVISLVGMGGLGKTTLAQLVDNHLQEKAHFDKRIWVCVSEPFDQYTIAKAIIQAFGGVDPNITELQSLLEKICELIGGKKFFLILDDVWTEDDTKWAPFKEAFKYGSQGSRILVTTHNKRVADKIQNVEIINLEVLSKEDCWLMFRKIAFFDKDPTLCEQLEDLGRKIVEKCKGLPLAAKTLGSLMRFKNSKEEWKSILDSSLWELEDDEIKVFLHCCY
ncbi:putative disease resistance protein RGA3 [Quercus suber]|uniref:putative disease resistance protein RGA3 n=1 Tax=Quercus suber TaxID=58331 RepID=UPI000CE191A7|nr:putative disease resistance protein RGA3 [Quercus suber]